MAAGGLFAAVHGTAGGAADTTAPRAPAVGSRLVTLATAIRAGDGNLWGNASLVVQTQTLSHVPPEITYNLYTDSGLYYGAANKTGLITAVAHHDNLSGMYARSVVAAARYAATGDLTAARARMATPRPTTSVRGLRPAARKRSCGRRRWRRTRYPPGKACLATAGADRQNAAGRSRLRHLV